MRKQPVRALYFEFKTVLKFYNLEACLCYLLVDLQTVCTKIKSDIFSGLIWIKTV